GYFLDSFRFVGSDSDLPISESCPLTTCTSSCVVVTSPHSIRSLTSSSFSSGTIGISSPSESTNLPSTKTSPSSRSCRCDHVRQRTGLAAKTDGSGELPAFSSLKMMFKITATMAAEEIPESKMVSTQERKDRKSTHLKSSHV